MVAEVLQGEEEELRLLEEEGRCFEEGSLLEVHRQDVRDLFPPKAWLLCAKMGPQGQLPRQLPPAR